MLTRMPVFQNLILFLSLPLLFSASSASHAPHSTKLLLPSDAVALLAFKSKADLGDKLPFSSRTRSVFCKWQGVKCSQNRAVRVVIEGLGLGGTLAPDSLIRLDQLRILSLQNNSLTGTIPDLSGLVNLKSLFLDHNAFHGSVPPSISTLHRLRTLDLAHNHLSGTIPSSLINLDRLYYLRLDSNRFEGSIPPLNQSFLQVFNVSRNNLTGAIPVTPAMLRFTTSSFRSNPGLCGEIIHIECRPIQPFFGPPSPIAPPPAAAALGQNGQLRRGAELEQRSAPQKQKHKKIAMIVGFSTGVFVLLGSVLCFIMATKKKQNPKALTTRLTSDTAANVDEAAVTRIQEDIDELEEKVMKAQFGKSGSLVFCAGESQLYSLEQLMRASAEMMGKGTMGTTYKAVLDNRLIVCVKRLDAGNLAGTSAESFNGLMESVGGLRHPNLVPLRAYFQAKDERLLVYDYQPNGSLFSLIHGSKSARARALHWTSCLKIADDVAQGLSYIHQAWRLVHGNLKSSNVLLGPDFEACLTDYCLSLLANNSPSAADDPDSAAHKAPEARRFNDQLTAKSDVYSFGVLLLELLTGKPPSQHPHVVVLDDIVNWVRSCREDGGGGGGGGGGEEEDRLEMLLEVAVVCRATSPEQRPTMWQVLKTIQEIKEAVVSEGDTNGLGPISQCRTAGPETP